MTAPQSRTHSGANLNNFEIFLMIFLLFLKIKLIITPIYTTLYIIFYILLCAYVIASIG